VCSEKTIVKVLSCTFSIAKLTTIAGDALTNPFFFWRGVFREMYLDTFILGAKILI
jgi:hypothetical protein